MPYNSFKGNLLFQSKNAFEGKTLSRRDDIISLIYLLVFLINGISDLYEPNENIKVQFGIVGQHKIKSSAIEFCTDKADIFIEVLEYAYSL